MRHVNENKAKSSESFFLFNSTVKLTKFEGSLETINDFYENFLQRFGSINK